MSMRPNARFAAATSAAGASFPRSSCMSYLAVRPSLPISATTLSSAALSRPVSITSQPSAARESAMPRPMPRLDPVTSATLPASPRSISRPHAGKPPLHLRDGDALVELNLCCADYPRQTLGLVAGEGAEFVRRVGDDLGALLGEAVVRGGLVQHRDGLAVQRRDDRGRRARGREQAEPGAGAIVEAAFGERRHV